MPVFLSGSLALTGSLTVTDQIVAQTLNVQQVTSSVVYSSGSNIFGNNLSNRQIFTGSLQTTGSTNYILGNVGIGDANPQQRLSVSHNINGSARLRLINENTGSSASSFLYAATVGNRYAGFVAHGQNATGTYAGLNLASLAVVEAGGDSSAMIINAGGTIPLVLATNTIERMRITSTGSVGIGTTNPVGTTNTNARVVEVYSPSANTNPSELKLSGNVGSTVALAQGSTASYLWSSGSYPLFIGTNSIERVQISAGGTLIVSASGCPFVTNSTNSNAFKIAFNDTGTNKGLIGATTALAFLVGNPAGDVLMSNDSTTGKAVFTLTSGNNGPIVEIARSAGAYAWKIGVDAANSNFNFYNNGNTSVANINPSTGAYTATSDARRKTNIVDSGPALELLEQVRVREYDWIDTGKTDKFGIVAQELHETLPEYVQEGDEETNWGIAKAEMVPMLIKAIQELSQRVKELEYLYLNNQNT